MKNRLKAYYGMALASFALAILSKEMAITFPALMFMVDIAMCDKGSRDIKGAFVRVLPLGLMAAVYLAARYAIFHSMGGYSDTTGRAIQAHLDTGVIVYNLVHIPKMLLLPVNTLLLKKPEAVYALISGVLVLSVAHRAAFGGPAIKYAILGLAWLAVAYLPAMTLSVAFPNLIGSRFAYIPSVGIAMIAGAIFGGTHSSGDKFKAVRAGLLATLVGCYVYVCFINYTSWSTAYEVAEFIPREVVKIAQDPPNCSDMYFIGNYDNYDGAYIYRNGLEDAVNIAYGPGSGRKAKVHFMDINGNSVDDPSVNAEALMKGGRKNLYIFYFSYKNKTPRLSPVYLPGKS